MSIYKLNCTQCDLVFDRILLNSDISGVHCSKCNSTDITRVFPDQEDETLRKSSSVPAGALSDAPCSSGFS